MPKDSLSYQGRRAVKIFSFISKISSTEFAVYDKKPEIVGELIENFFGMAAFENTVEILNETIAHAHRDLNAFMTPEAQGLFRYKAVMERLERLSEPLKEVGVVITLMTSLHLPPGIYLVNHDLLNFLKEGRAGESTIRAGAFMSWYFAEYINDEYDFECLPLLVQAAIQDELNPIATLTGIKGISRSPVFHCFSQRVAAAYYAASIGLDPNSINVVIAHLGTEISVSAYQMGRIVDSNSPFDGEGPFSPTTSGTLPSNTLLQLCFSRKYDMDEMLRLVNQEGGLKAHLGTASLDDIRRAYAEGDPHMRFVVNAMAYQVAKEIGARAAALEGKTQQIVITGPWLAFEDFVNEIVPRVEWIAPVSFHIWASELFMVAVAGIDVYYRISGHRILIYGQDRF